MHFFRAVQKHLVRALRPTGSARRGRPILNFKTAHKTRYRDPVQKPPLPVAFSSGRHRYFWCCPQDSLGFYE
jgi:hypothetical protein